MLTGEVEAPALADELHRHNASLDIVTAHDLPALTKAAEKFESGTRLLSFCTPVIVPRHVLEALPGPAYNFHPGPPERPGRYPSVFALYDGSPRFGITVHEMVPKVDSGAIVAAEWFDIPKDCDLMELESLTLVQLIKTFRRFAPYLATFSLPLPHHGIHWQGRKTTKADCMALCQLTPDMNPEEIARRRRCCGIHLPEF